MFFVLSKRVFFVLSKRVFLEFLRRGRFELSRGVDLESREGYFWSGWVFVFLSSPLTSRFLWFPLDIRVPFVGCGLLLLGLWLSRVFELVVGCYGPSYVVISFVCCCCSIGKMLLKLFKNDFMDHALHLLLEILLSRLISLWLESSWCFCSSQYQSESCYFS